MKTIQFVLLIMLAAGLRNANAVAKTDCAKLQNKTGHNQQLPQVAAANFLRVFDGGKSTTPASTAPAKGVN